MWVGGGGEQLVDDYLKDKTYDEDKVAQWINDICEGTASPLCADSGAAALLRCTLLAAAVVRH